jgi:hypothetical protein
MELTQSLNVCLNFGQGSSGRLILQKPCVENALELNISIS